VTTGYITGGTKLSMVKAEIPKVVRAAEDAPKPVSQPPEASPGPQDRPVAAASPPRTMTGQCPIGSPEYATPRQRWSPAVDPRRHRGSPAETTNPLVDCGPLEIDKLDRRWSDRLPEEDAPDPGKALGSIGREEADLPPALPGN